MLALASLFVVPKLSAISFSDIQLWTGSGTNQAALVIEWSVPQSLTNSIVPVPVADKALVWGYRFNGTANGTQMLDAVLATDPKLYVVESNAPGTLIEGIGYNLNANGVIGITDGTYTNYITNGNIHEWGTAAISIPPRRSTAAICTGAVPAGRGGSCGMKPMTRVDFSTRPIAARMRIGRRPPQISPWVIRANGNLRRADWMACN